MWGHVCASERAFVLIIPGYKRLSKKIANNFLTNEDNGKLFPVYKLLTQAFLLVLNPILYLLFYLHDFNLLVNTQQ